MTIPAITFYNPVNNNNQAFNFTISADCSNTMVYTAGPVIGLSTTILVPDIIAGGGGAGNAIGFHYTADSRLGV